MVARLKIKLLGTPQVEIDNTPVNFQRRKTLALLIYLAVTRQPHTRDTLATLLWPDYPQANARTSLRQSVNELKSALGEDWLESDRELVALHTDQDAWVDAQQFQQKLIESQANPPALAEAVALYQGNFVTGFTLPDSPDFDEWQSFQAENF